MIDIKNCIFCEIIQGNQNAYVIYQNNFVTAFLDIYPATNGHILLIPNQHIVKLNKIIDADVSAAIMESLILVTNRLIDSGMCVDFSILQENGDLANQDIKHLHFHIIPRYKEDQVEFILNTDDEAALKTNLIAAYNKLNMID